MVTLKPEPIVENKRLRLHLTISDFTIYDGDFDENVTSKYNFALS